MKNYCFYHKFLITTKMFVRTYSLFQNLSNDSSHYSCKGGQHKLSYYDVLK